MADNVCGQPKANGQPCQYPSANRCPTHNRKPKASALPAVSLPARSETVGRHDGPHNGSVRDAAAIRLARGEGVTATAAALNLPTSTVSDWKRDPVFAAEVQRLRGDMVDELSGTMSADAKQLWAVILEGAAGRAKPVQVKAAVDGLRLMLTYREAADLEARLAALEAAARRPEGEAGDQQWL